MRCFGEDSAMVLQWMLTAVGVFGFASRVVYLLPCSALPLFRCGSVAAARCQSVLETTFHEMRDNHKGPSGVRLGHRNREVRFSSSRGQTAMQD